MQQHTDVAIEYRAATCRDRPQPWDESSIVDRTDLIHDHIGRSRESRFTATQVDSHELCMRMNLSREWTYNRRGMTPIEEISLNHDDRSDLARLRASLRVEVGQPYVPFANRLGHSAKSP